MTWGTKIFAGTVLVLILAGAGLAIHGSNVQPERKTVERVLPDERFPK
ncbi:MAG: hypothetical protein ACT4OG_01115 [Alphaproteobacteria bacterium]